MTVRTRFDTHGSLGRQPPSPRVNLFGNYS
jgi:hypothetical protein